MRRLLAIPVILLSIMSMGQVRLRLAPAAGGSQSLIAWSDFTYAGSYQVPVSTFVTSGDPAGDTRASTAFTGRYVSGTLHFMGVTGDNANGEVGLYEFDLDGQAPGMGSTIASLPVARMLQDYGASANHDGVTNIFYAQGAGAGVGCTDFFGRTQLWSIRAVGARLYWAYGNSYPGGPACAQDGGLGFSTLGTYPAPPSNPHSYILDGNGYKSGQHGFVEVPTSWSNGAYANLAGMTVAQATGGYESIISIGGTSMGPSLIPFVPPAGTEPQRTAISHYPLMQYQSGGGCSPRALKPVMSPVYTNDADSCDSTVFGFMDRLRGAEWINTTNRRGILHFVSFATGQVSYIAAQGFNQGTDTEVLITDPASLVTIANGGAAASTAAYATHTQIQWPFYDYSTACGQIVACSYTAVTALSTSGATATATVADSSLTAVNTRFLFTGANESEFTGGWIVVSIPDSTHFTFCTGSNGGHFSGTSCTDGGNWSNASGSGTMTYTNMQQTDNTILIGVWFDATTNTLWTARSRYLTKMVVSKYTCAAC